MKAQTNRKTFEDMSANAKQEMYTWEAQRVKVNIWVGSRRPRLQKAKNAKGQKPVKAKMEKAKNSRRPKKLKAKMGLEMFSNFIKYFK